MLLKTEVPPILPRDRIKKTVRVGKNWEKTMKKKGNDAYSKD
jgi:hypothetical protein